MSSQISWLISKIKQIYRTADRDNFRLICKVLMCEFCMFVAFVFAVCVYGHCYPNVLVVNSTISAPRGIYKKIHTKNEIVSGRYTIKKGDLVAFRVKDLYAKHPEVSDKIFLDHITGSDTRIFKKVTATAGSVVTKDLNNRLYVDGKIIPNAVIFPFYRKSGSRVKVLYPYLVKMGEVYCLSEMLYSHDSRYFGAVPIDIIDHVLAPVITFN